MKVLKHDLFTNDVLYAEIVFNMRSLKQELLPLVPLFWLDVALKIISMVISCCACFFFSCLHYEHMFKFHLGQAN